MTDRATPFLTGRAKVAGVMGWPVEHSKSPRLHGYWLRHYQIDGAYVPMAVRPEHLERALRALPAHGIRGVNLTIPHKEEALRFVDKMDPLATRVGAINTIIVHEDDSLEGRNTDVFGFSENMKAAGYALNHVLPHATILGAGGAARAIVVALQDMGFHEIRIVNRNQARAEEMAASLPGQNIFKVFGWDKVDSALAGAGLLVNSSSLGMEGQPPLEIDLKNLPKEAWVTDAVYAPLETAFLKQAQARGNQTVDGLGMLLHQARPGFAAWFGQDPEVTEELRNHVLDLK